MAGANWLCRIGQREGGGWEGEATVARSRPYTIIIFVTQLCYQYNLGKSSIWSHFSCNEITNGIPKFCKLFSFVRSSLLFIEESSSKKRNNIRHLSSLSTWYGQKYGFCSVVSYSRLTCWQHQFSARVHLMHKTSAKEHKNRKYISQPDLHH